MPSTEQPNMSFPMDAGADRRIAVCVLGSLVFPLILVLSLAVPAVQASVLLVYTSSQLGLLLDGMRRYRLAKPYWGVFTLLLSACLLYNRHWDAQPDNSPFSDGAGEVGQTAYGFIAYYRVFDRPLPDIGHTHVDWLALTLDIQIVTFITATLLAARSMYSRRSPRS